MATWTDYPRLDRLCGKDERFWEHELFHSANASRIELTPCFQHTALVYVPALVTVLLFIVLVTKLLKSTRLPLPYSCSVVTKLVLAVLVCIVCLALGIFGVYEYMYVTTDGGMGTLVYPFVLFGAFAVILLETHCCQRYGILTSGCLYISLVVFCVCGLAELQWWVTEAMMHHVSSASTHTVTSQTDFLSDRWIRFSLFIVYYALVVALTIAHSFADALHPADMPDTETACPELYRSFVSQLTFWWFTPLCWTGYRRPLERGDLWKLNDRDASKRLVDRWTSYWSKSMDKYQRRMREETHREAHVEHAKLTTSQDVHLKSGEDKVEFLAGKSSTTHKTIAHPSVFVALLKCFYGTLLPAMLMKFTHDTLAFAGPQLLKAIIHFVSDRSAPLWRGVLIAVTMFLVTFIQSMVLHQYFHRMFRVGMNIKAVLTASIFSKSLRLSNTARKERTAGEITNLMSVDVQRFVDIATFGMLYFSAPLQIGLAIYFLWQELGVSVLAGVAVLVLMIPINFVLTMKMRKMQAVQMKHKDERLKMMNEVLKLYAWEPSMEKIIESIRLKEIIILKKIAYLNAATTLTWTSAPFLVAVISFAAYVLSDEANVLTPDKTFVALALFNILRFPMSMLAMLIGQTVMLSVSNKRIKAFLAAEELDPSVVKRTTGGASTEAAIDVEGGVFAWEAGKTTLNDVQLSIGKGQLVAIVGRVGCGKSSLLNAVLGEMDKEAGEVTVRGSVSYVPQQAWIQNLTLRENITFNGEFHDEQYANVLDACALTADLSVLPGGDSTEIGERGINLSGGQKQRVSLARAVYQDRDIYLLDDPLSAVDTHVGKHIFDKVIGKNGVLANKTRILVTHGLHFLQQVDTIVVMKEGRISETGSYAELMGERGDFADFLEEHLIEEAARVKSRRETDAEGGDVDDDSDDDADTQLETVMEELCKYDPSKRKRLQTQLSRTDSNSKKAGRRSPTKGSGGRVSPLKSATRSVTHSESRASETRSEAPALDAKEKLVTKEDESKKLIQTETAETGKVKWRVYMLYIHAIGYMIATLFIIIFVASSILGVASNIWLAAWADENEAHPHRVDTRLKLGVFAMLGLGQALFVCVASLILALGMVSASMKLHTRLVHNLMQSPMSFYDTTPLGRIINRVGKDIDTLDATLPMTIRMFAMCVMGVLATLFVIIYATPVFVVVLPPLAIIYIYALDMDIVDSQLTTVLVMCVTFAIQGVIYMCVVCYPVPALALVLPPLILVYTAVLRFYVSTARQLKRIVSVSLSPIYSHFQEAVQGAVSIRAYNVMDKFELTSESHVDNHLECHYPTLVANRWLAVRLEFVGNTIVLSAALFAVVFRDSGITAGLVGLSITYALNITQTLNWAVRMSSDLEANIVSVERITEYSESETEAAWTSLTAPPKEWPAHGQIEFVDLAVRYREGLDLVLHGLNATVKPREKVGIVGRTGAGKSSLTLSLFRIIEAAGGKIIIDGVDIATIGLHELRDKLTIIPQGASADGPHDSLDPVLFAGTLRMNLDPFDRFSDEQIWRALEHAHLKAFVDGQDDKLDYVVSEGGENLSVGQRQLLCLARALLRKTAILIMDEATAAVDMETDALIQKTIHVEFKDCTILTIAHRLNTIIDSDRVLVLAGGRIAEYDSPRTLMDDKTSLFHDMCKEAGLI